MADLIDRQAAIDVLNVGAELLNRVLDDADIVGVERAKYEWGIGLIESYIYDMKELPSAQPERKKGKWIKKKGSLWTLATCSVCGELSVEGDKPFCPNCGAEMGGKS